MGRYLRALWGAISGLYMLAMAILWFTWEGFKAKMSELKWSAIENRLFGPEIYPSYPPTNSDTTTYRKAEPRWTQQEWTDWQNRYKKPPSPIDNIKLPAPRDIPMYDGPMEDDNEHTEQGTLKR